MPLTVLTDYDVRILLHSLTQKDILTIQQSLADALHYYSTAVEEDDNGCCASYQPKRTHLQRKDGTTTLFMPATGTDGLGVKIVTLKEASAKAQERKTSLESGSVSSGTADSAAASSASSLRQSSLSSASSSTPASSVAAGMSELSVSSKNSSATTASTVSTGALGTKTTPLGPNSEMRPAMQDLKMKAAATSPSGSLTLMNRDGTMRGLINAAEITAFRTALAATMLFKKRENVHDVVIFGAGKQAYWHARLALLLRGSEVHHLNFINRSFDTVTDLLHDLYKVPWPVQISHPNTAIFTPAHSEYARHLKSTLRSSSVIFCTTPSTEPLFPPEILTSTEGRRKGRYISAIGSYKPHMIEIHTDIIKQAVAPPHKHHHHKHAKQGGAIVVDSVDACLTEAGEIIQAGLGGREVVELGELVMLKKEAERRRQERTNSLDSAGVELLDTRKKGGKKDDEDDGGLKEWLSAGNVIYKSVGLGLMDVVVGMELCDMADRLGVGTRIDGF